MWIGIRMSDQKGVEGCCEDWEKAGAVLQRLVLGEEVWWNVSWKKEEEQLKCWLMVRS